MQDKILEIEYKRAIYDSDRRRLIRLQKERECIFDALFETPSNSESASQLNAIEIRIAAITGESVVEY